MNSSSKNENKNENEIVNDADNDYKQIQLLDILPNQILGLDIYLYLPTNNKYVKYINASDTMDFDQLQRLKFKKINELFIKRVDIEKYNRYISSNIRALLNTNANNEEAKQKSVKVAAELIISSIDMLSSDSDIIEWNNNCVELTKTVIDDIVQTDDISTAFDSISDYLSDRPTLANHSLVVSSLGVIIAMSLGNSDPRTLSEIAYGGLVHDIGLGELPSKVSEKYFNNEEMTLAEMALLKEHPRKGVILLQRNIKSKNITDNVLKIVFEHHENICGKGYPNGLSYNELSYLPKIISIADKLSFKMMQSRKEDISLKYIVLNLMRDQAGKELLDNKMIKVVLENLSYGRTK
ncbi:MAG: HD domain-containing protein [Oligoflexia bacterium]|nr:HD domain-containing protein [Oligoflexia bacterium]